MAARFVSEKVLGSFLGRLLAGRAVYGTKMEEGVARLSKMPAEEIEIGPCRALEPSKPLFFSPREDVGGYFAAWEGVRDEERAVVGLAGCDLAALRVLDHVFLEGDFVDPFYKTAREKTLVVSIDCGEPGEKCFCTFVDGKPYGEEGFDVNLSPVEGGCIAEAGSKRGGELLESAGGGLPEASDEQMKAREAMRERAVAKVKAQAGEKGLVTSEGLQEAVKARRDDGLWEEMAGKCVECAACNFICPTCHCFLLVDLQERENFRRFRNWDACLYPGFAREASGANPRGRRAERLRGRIEKKFDFLKENFGGWGCVGCGRCVEACAGEIDIRETLRELVNAKPVSSD